VQSKGKRNQEHTYKE